MLTRILVLFFSTFLIFSCSKDPVDPTPEPSCNSLEMSFQSDITPILSACLVCHSTSAAFGGIILDNYNNVKAVVDNGTLLGSIRHESGFSSMPQGGDKLEDCNITKIASWISDGALDN